MRKWNRDPPTCGPLQLSSHGYAYCHKNFIHRLLPLTSQPRFTRKMAVSLLVVRSRLGCQVTVTKEMNDFEVDVPGGTADARG